MESDKIIVTVDIHRQNKTADVEMSPDITCNELIAALNSVYGLNFDISDMSKCCLKCENPTALLRGIHTLREYGVRTGSIIHII